MDGTPHRYCVAGDELRLERTGYDGTSYLNSAATLAAVLTSAPRGSIDDLPPAHAKHHPGPRANAGSGGLIEGFGLALGASYFAAAAYLQRYVFVLQTARLYLRLTPAHEQHWLLRL